MFIQAFLFWGLVFSLGSGIVLRLSFAGFLPEYLALDWYRTHTHAGYYLFFLPLVLWQNNFFARQRYFWFFSFFTILIFLTQGYSLLAKILSGGVFFIWLASIWRHRQRFSNQEWHSQLLPGMLLSLFFLIAVIVLPKMGLGVTAAASARAFLTAILFGVIVPYVLGTLKQKPGLPFWFFHISVFFYGLYVTGLLSFWWGCLSGIVIGFFIMRSLVEKFRYFLWGPVAGGLVLLPLVPNNAHHAFAVAGVHYIFLGAIILTIFEKERFLAKGLFWVLVMQMCLMILAQPWVQWNFRAFHGSLAFIGGILILLLLRMRFWASVQNVNTSKGSLPF
ncbi:MAG: hypothetical protein ACLGGX_12075 [Bdellovibrionia bacterium]